MITVVKKELQQYFSGMLGYLSIGVFLLVSGIVVFILPETSVLAAGYASMDAFFEVAPFIMLFLLPAITMKTFSDEYKNGTFEVLRTTPVSVRSIVAGKFLASLVVAVLALVCTLVYPVSLSLLSPEGIDTGGVIGSYIGLIMLCGVYASIGIFTSSLQQNAVAAFLLGALSCYLIYSVFSSISNIGALGNDFSYYFSLIGIRYHYENMSKGFIDTRDLIYFLSVMYLFMHLTVIRVKNRR
jgi:ABC-2 type transport system permease protein